MNECKKHTRKLWVRIVLLVLCLTLAAGGAVTILADGFSGDFDGDGVVTAFDAQLLAEHKAGLRDLGLAADITLTVQDILDWILGKTEAEPSLADGIEKTFTVEIDENNLTTEEQTVTAGCVTVTVPAGVLVTGESLTITVKQLDTTTSDVTLEEGQELLPLDIHMEGVAEGNTTPIIICVAGALDTGLNFGNLHLYHVENGETVAMTQVSAAEEVDVHNEFYYDPATGDIIVAMASFSEVAAASDTDKAWEGKIATAFNDGSGTKNDPYIIANADQLAYMSKAVSNDESEDGTYAGAYYKLVADINLNGDTARTTDNKNLIFYPIGYWAEQKGTNSAGETYYGAGNSFYGTFDGNGNTIGNIYQNTWLMDGNYDAGYWKTAMGLFGALWNATIKNLTIDNFQSDGEYTPTGCIAAYAGGQEMLFENIQLTNCNPRVYNTGNGGLVGLNYNSTSGTADEIVFRNVTVDQTNKISALWGSYDVSCGGILGRLRENSNHDGTNTTDQKNTVIFENCHVAAIMDVNNDCCANYQYYQYRYSGMFIGTVDYIGDVEAVGLEDVVTATDCTYTYGDWNEYWYCELVKNTLASYTHDHQFSRLTKITAVTDIQDEDGNWNTEGNFVLPAADNSSAVCYHIFKDSDGNLYQHFHNVKDETNTDIYETTDLDGDGELNDLKEDRQCYYIPFGQLWTGYGWGSTPWYNNGNVETIGIALKEDGPVKSEQKFTALNVTTVEEEKAYNLSDLVELVVNERKLSKSTLSVFVSPVDGSNVTAAVSIDTNTWGNSTLTFSGEGAAKIVITDYFYCTETVLNVTVDEKQPVEKFGLVFPNTESYLYRVGNAGGSAVALSSLFTGTNVTEGKVEVTVDKVAGDATGEYTANDTDWTQGTIQFSGTGVVTVTITDNDYCTPTELNLEVVDAVNATSATSATANNVVMLNDCSFSSLEVSGGYALYGNGFTMTCSTDSVAKDLGYSFVTLEDGTLDNIQIVCPNFDYAALYKSNLTNSDNRSYTDSSGTVRYYNAKSGVMVSGNSQILNSRISGARAAVNISGGNCVIENSRIELGAVASVLVGAANSVTLKDVTLVQKPAASTYDSSKTLMGFSVLVMATSGGDAAPITLEGTLIQNAWVDENDKQYVPSDAQSIIETVMDEEDYLHDIDGDGTNESLNLGIAYMPADGEYTVNEPSITDNRTNKDTVPYASVEVKYSLVTTYVYSYTNGNGTDDSVKTEATYTPDTQSDIITVNYADTADGLTTGKSYGTDGWIYELNVDLDTLSGYALDFSKLTMSVNGIVQESYTVTDASGNAVDTTSPITVVAGGTTYTLTVTIDGVTYTATYKVTGTETSKESPSLVATDYEAGLCVASSYGGTWHGAAPALEGIQIKYWSVAEKQYKTITLSDYTPTTAGQQNGTNNYWTYTPDNGDFTLTIKNETPVHSGNSVYAMPVVCDSKLYFVASSSNGLVNSGNTARTIALTYYFDDNNNGDQLTFSNTWSVEENTDEQYKYSDFCSGTKTKLENCITGDTLITLADGSQVRVDALTGSEELLVWNLETGSYDTAPIVFVDSDEEAEYEVINLYFSDGAQVGVIYEHGFFDYDLGEYVYIDAANAQSYVGHHFVTQGSIEDGTWNTAILTKVEIETKVETAYSPVTFEHLCYYTDGVLSMPGGISGLFNIFEVDTSIMAYDAEKKAADIAQYGLFTLEDFDGMITEEAFYAFNGAYLKVAMAKGLLTWEDIACMAERYIPLM